MTNERDSNPEPDLHLSCAPIKADPTFDPVSD